jgi:hypothetical protein
MHSGRAREATIHHHMTIANPLKGCTASSALDRSSIAHSATPNETTTSAHAAAARVRK